MAEKKLVTKLKEEIRRRNYSYKTEKAYSQWIVRYVKFHGLKHPVEMDEILRNEPAAHLYLSVISESRNLAANSEYLGFL